MGGGPAFAATHTTAVFAARRHLQRVLSFLAGGIVVIVEHTQLLRIAVTLLLRASRLLRSRCPPQMRLREVSRKRMKLRVPTLMLPMMLRKFNLWTLLLCLRAQSNAARTSATIL
jgi:hypothetical protein